MTNVGVVSYQAIHPSNASGIWVDIVTNQVKKNCLFFIISENLDQFSKVFMKLKKLI